MKLLLASADETFAVPIVMGLRLRGHDVERTVSGLIAFTLPPDNAHDAILIDDNLPYLAGVEVVQHLRWRQVRQPIVLLATYGSEGHRRIAGEAGTSALLVKPTTAGDIDTMLTTLRRPTGGLTQTTRCGEIEVDRGRRLAIRNGRTILLTPAQTRLLWALAEQPGDVVDREVLYDKVFRYCAGDLPSMLSSVVNSLRKRLIAPGEADPIITVRGIGYRLATSPTTDQPRQRLGVGETRPSRPSLAAR